MWRERVSARTLPTTLIRRMATAMLAVPALLQ